MKSNLLFSILILTSIIICSSCETKKKKRVLNLPETDLASENMIPKPLKVISTNKGFALDKFTSIYTSENTSGYAEVGEFLTQKIKEKTGLDIPVNTDEIVNQEGVIYINKSDSLELETLESYQIYILQNTRFGIYLQEK